MNAWRESARCRHLGPELFFPAEQLDPRNYQRQVNAVRAVCATCPVATTCLSYAVEMATDSGSGL